MKNTNSESQKILDLYSNYVLRNNKKPLNVFVFCEDNGMTEAEFYQYYSGFDQLEGHFLSFFMQQTIELIASEETYHRYEAKDKMLAFYFTFFEQLTLNRSLIMYLLNDDTNSLQTLKKLLPLKKEFREFVSELDISESVFEVSNEKMEKVEKLKNRSVEELYWGHFLTTLKFWLQDTSPNFEKTDLFIEKSLDTSFTFLEITPLRKLVDLGKFLFKEKIKMN